MRFSFAIHIHKYSKPDSIFKLIESDKLAFSVLYDMHLDLCSYKTHLDCSTEEILDHFRFFQF